MDIAEKTSQPRTSSNEDVFASHRRAYVASTVDQTRQTTVQVLLPALAEIARSVTPDTFVEKTPVVLQQENTDAPLRFVDFFCGIGSFHRSFSALGMECVSACDVSAVVRRSYERMYDMIPSKDIRNVDPVTLPKYDILCAGFPCQAWSQSGLKDGFSDPRGDVFFVIMKFLEDPVTRPKYVLLENVPGLLTHDNGNSFVKIRAEMEARGYVVVWSVLKASDYGIPQMRRRLLILGIHVDCPSARYASRFFCTSQYKSSTTLSEYLGRDFERENAFTIRIGGRASKIDDRHNWRHYRLGDGSTYALSLEDALSLQGFPRDTPLQGSDGQKWSQVGNSIPTCLTRVMGERLLVLDKWGRQTEHIE